jgi:hypothetical protein
MHIVTASLTVASFDITGSTQRRVCFLFKTSDIVTSEIFRRGKKESSLASFDASLTFDFELTSGGCFDVFSATSTTEENG